MDRRRNARWAVKWCSFFASVAFMAVADGHPETSIPSSCGGDTATNLRERFLMLVSTMDGRMTALNVLTGEEAWSVSTGTESLLSSSITTKMEVMDNGVPNRLIPSLDGSLYQFDGEKIKPVPLAADVLLSNSFRFKDDSMVVGGTETTSYGIDMKTGAVRYVCSSAGCKYMNSAGSETNTDEDEVMVVSRHTKTVRSVELRSGHEKWNFSVGQHELSYVRHNKPENPHITSENPTESGANEHCNVQTEDEESYFDFPHWFSNAQDEKQDVDFKVIVPSGLVIAVKKSDPKTVLWQHKFGTAIADAWSLENGVLSEISLFDDHFIPALSHDSSTIGDVPADATGGYDTSDTFNSPLLYMGIHEKQLYVQPSVQFIQQLEDAATEARKSNGEVAPISMPCVRWRPYLASAPSRTPIIAKQLTWDGATAEERGLTLWQDQYPFDGGYTVDSGYYLFSDYTPNLKPMLNNRSFTHTDTLQDFTASLKFYWREVVALSLLTSVFVHLFFIKVFYKKQHDAALPTVDSESKSKETVGSSSSEAGLEELTVINGKKETNEYDSRYYTDFEQDACLGRGGFGVVFQSRNRIDDCSYAIKRISLNKSDGAREKVMREVKALAKLSHNGIVRYHQAWFESPPAGWQEEKDRVNIDMPSTTPSPAYSITEYNPASTSPQRSTTGAKHSRALKRLRPAAMEFLNGVKGRGHSNLKIDCSTRTKSSGNIPDVKPSAFNPLRPFGGMEFPQENSEVSKGYSEWNMESEPTEGWSSEGFIPNHQDGILSQDGECDDSGSYSKGLGSSNKPHVTENMACSIDSQFLEDSFDISFQDESKSRQQNADEYSIQMPFSHYDKREKKTGNVHFLEDNSDSMDSVDIVFEDSGCMEKSLNNEDAGWGDDDHAIIDINSSHSGSHGNGLRSRLKTRQCDTNSSHISDTPVFFLGDVTSNLQHSFRDPTSTSPPRPTQLDIPQRSMRPGPGGLQSPVVPKLFLYIQMELCRPDSLKDWLSENTLQRDRRLLLDVFHQIVSAVDYVHGQGLMHRDLKPSNIFFSMDGAVKIGDFGLVTAVEENCEYYSDFDSPVYHKHTDQVGTKLYMSPEQTSGRNYTSKVDIFALGMIFFELFFPFATQMERIKTLVEVKRQLFPKRFIKELKDEYLFVRPLLCQSAEERPDTKAILGDKILREFEGPLKAYTVARARSTSRIRTFSTSSNHSGSGSSPPGSPTL